MIWLSVICSALAAVIVILVVKTVLMKKDIDAIGRELTEKLEDDTNTLITVSSGDGSIRRLAAQINAQLKILRSRRLRYERGDTELKNAVANVSHDLRTPLTAIEGYLDLLGNERMNKNVARYIGIIKNRADTLKQLSEELFCYSVISSPERELPKERVSVNAVLEECIAENFERLRRAGIEPSIAMPEKTVFRTVNRVALSRIFSNIVENAVKYSDGDLRVELDATSIRFSNSASELTAVRAERLFDRFYTVDGARKSTGLGLSIARTLVEQTGGTIGAEYRDGILTIAVCLP